VDDRVRDPPARARADGFVFAFDCVKDRRKNPILQCFEPPVNGDTAADARSNKPDARFGAMGYPVDGASAVAGGGLMARRQAGPDIGDVSPARRCTFGVDFENRAARGNPGRALELLYRLDREP
jgi:hypothetical protein